MEAESQLAKPRYYAIKDGDRYYVALAVVEYDMSKATSDEQKKGVQQVKDMFDRGLSGGLSAADITQDYIALGCMITWVAPREDSAAY